jgi:hypothetical protein
MIYVAMRFAHLLLTSRAAPQMLVDATEADALENSLRDFLLSTSARVAAAACQNVHSGTTWH